MNYFELTILFLMIHFGNLLAALFQDGVDEKNVQLFTSLSSRLALAGSSIRLNCPIEATFYMWRLHRVGESSRAILDQDTKILKIDKARTDQSGVYQCRSTSGFDNTDTNITLKIIDKNSQNHDCKIEEIKNGKIKGICFASSINGANYYQPGDSVDMDCQVALGDDMATNRLIYTWTYQPDNRNSIQRIPIGGNVSRQVIRRVKKKDIGLYRCEVAWQDDNDILKLTREFQVNVYYKKPNKDIKITPSEFNEELPNKKSGRVLKCDIQSEYARIGSVKWAVQLPADTKPHSLEPGSYMPYDSRIFQFISHGVRQYIQSPSHAISQLHLGLIPLDISYNSLFLCIAVSDEGATSLHTFSPSFQMTEGTPTSTRTHKPPIIILYILLPALIIFISLTCIICCCIRHHNKRLQHSNITTHPNKPLHNSSTTSTQPRYVSPTPHNYRIISSTAGGPAPPGSITGNSSQNSYCTTNNV